jgi:hypothetical protein
VGKTTFVIRGEHSRHSSRCPYPPPSARIPDTEANIGRITDLMVHGDQLWIADAGCRRLLRLQLDGT